MSRPGQPTPNTAPNPTTTPEHPVLSRVGGLALTAVGGYAMHKGLHAEALGNPAEHMGTPAGEVLEASVIGSTLALTGLRTYVTDARLGIARHRATKAEIAEQKAERNAKLIKDSHARIMEGKSIPYDNSGNNEKIDEEDWSTLSLSEVGRLVEQRAEDNMEDFERIRDGKPIELKTNDKIGNITQQDVKSTRRSILHPFRKPEITPSRSWRHGRAVRKMVKSRNKRNKIQNEEYSTQRWMGNGAHFETDYRNPKPLSDTDDLGTVIGWKRFMQTPRTRLEISGYRRASKSASHEHHKAHEINENMRKRYVEGSDLNVSAKAAKKARFIRKAEKLEDKKSRIENRQDLVSRAYDTTKSKTKSGAKRVAKVSGKVAKASNRGLRTGGRAVKRHVDKQVDAIKSAPDAYREARDGRAGNSGPVQERVNRVARNLGARRGRSKAPAS